MAVTPGIGVAAYYLRCGDPAGYDVDRYQDRDHLSAFDIHSTSRFNSATSASSS